MENEGRFSMGAAVRLRSDYTSGDLRRLGRASRNADQTRRLLALAAIYEGASRTMAARIGGVGLQIIRDWVLRFNEEGPEGLLDRKAPGKMPLLTKEQRAALAQTVEAGPKPYLDGVVRWRLVDLAQWLWEEFGVSVSRQTLGRELRSMGFRKLSARPRHYAQDAEAIAEFKKTSPPSWRPSGRSLPLERR
jgi:transposase